MVGIVALFLLVLLVHPQPPQLAVGARAPAISLKTPAGERHNLVGHGEGRPVVVEFLETACMTCQEKAGSLCAAVAAHPSVVLAGVDAGDENAQVVNGYQARYVPAGCGLVLLLDPGLSVSKSYEVAVVPTVYVIDKNGNIAFAGVGAGGIDSVAAALRQIGA